MDKIRRSIFRLGVLLLTLGLVGCGGEETTPAPPGVPPDLPPLTLRSEAFAQGEAIPAQYTCDGADTSPPLSWEAPPEGTQSLALIMDDPDAPGGVWTHWVVYNLPPDTRSLAVERPAGETLPGGGVQGANSWGDPTYGGPCPPSGEHRYIFTLYALDTELELEPGAEKTAVLAAMEGRILARGSLMGTYQQ